MQYQCKKGIRDATNQSLSECLSNGVHLGDVSSTRNADLDVDVGESFFANNENRLLNNKIIEYYDGLAKNYEHGIKQPF